MGGRKTVLLFILLFGKLAQAIHTVKLCLHCANTMGWKWIKLLELCVCVCVCVCVCARVCEGMSIASLFCCFSKNKVLNTQNWINYKWLLYFWMQISEPGRNGFKFHLRNLAASWFWLIHVISLRIRWELLTYKIGLTNMSKMRDD